MPLIQWTDERVRRLGDAAERSDYYERLAAAIVEALGGAAAVADYHVCDAGCGLGYLSLALSRYVRRVTAIDEADAPLGALRTQLARRKIAHVEPMRADVWALPADLRFDVIVFCLIGSASEILRCAAMHGRRAVIVKRDPTPSATRIGGHAPHGDALAEMLQALADIPHTRRDLRLSLDQPLRSPADASHFIGLYGTPVAPEIARRRLIPVPDAEFPYRLPVHRALSILTYDTMRETEGSP